LPVIGAPWLDGGSGLAGCYNMAGPRPMPRMGAGALSA